MNRVSLRRNRGDSENPRETAEFSCIAVQRCGNREVSRLPLRPWRTWREAPKRPPQRIGLALSKLLLRSLTLRE